MSTPKFDAGIPVLTEVIAPPAERDVSDNVVTDPPQTAVKPPKEALASGQTSVAEHLTVAQLRHIENEVMENVLHQLLGRIDFVLEQRVRDSLADVLQTTVGGLATEIRQGLQQTLEDVIARAVAQEITRLQTTKK